MKSIGDVECLDSKFPTRLQFELENGVTFNK